MSELSGEVVYIHAFDLAYDMKRQRIARMLGQDMADWHGVINVKLRTLAELYQLLYQDRINSWMVVLEATIVLLFILDVLLLLVGL